VVCFLNDEAPQTLVEQAAAERAGVKWYNVPLTGDGASTPEQRERIKSLLLGEHEGPMLVHCAAGVNRTGLGVGLYRIYKQGWSYEQVLDEMRGFDFDDEPKHENLRAALRAEAAAAAARSVPAQGP
jgi:protein tyrosine/serine phosphatase